MARAVRIDLGTMTSAVAAVMERGGGGGQDGLLLQVVRGEADAVRFGLRRGLCAPEEIAAEILRELTADAARYLGEKADHVVITVPAYLDDAQRQATKDAGTIGLETTHQETVLVFDLGGGTFDVSLLDVGGDFDKRILDRLADEFKVDQGVDLRNDPQALQRLYEAVERAKLERSSHDHRAQTDVPASE